MSRCRLEPGSDVLGGAGSRAAVVIVWCVMWTVSTLIPAEGLSGISKNTTCESDFYFDHGTDSCEHCCDICCNAEQAGVEDQCESLCGAYDPKMREEYEAAKKKKNDAQQKSAIEMEIPSRRSTSSDTSNASMPVGAQVAIYVACVASLVTLFVLVFVKRKTIVSKCRRGGVSDQQDPESAVPLQPQQDSSTALEMVVVGAVCREAHSTRTQPQMNISPALELATAPNAAAEDAYPGDPGRKPEILEPAGPAGPQSDLRDRRRTEHGTQDLSPRTILKCKTLKQAHCYEAVGSWPNMLGYD